MIKHTNIKHNKKESLKNLFSKLSYSQTSDSHKFQIIQNLNYSNLKTTGTNINFVFLYLKQKYSQRNSKYNKKQLKNKENKKKSKKK